MSFSSKNLQQHPEINNRLHAGKSSLAWMQREGCAIGKEQSSTSVNKTRCKHIPQEGAFIIYQQTSKMQAHTLASGSALSFPKQDSVGTVRKKRKKEKEKNKTNPLDPPHKRTPPPSRAKLSHLTFLTISRHPLHHFQT
eukprot:scaffold204590_cov19-Tisochrysis_lutea.AAC.1